MAISGVNCGYIVRSSHPRALRLSMAAASVPSSASGKRKCSRESVSHNHGKKASRLVHLPAVLHGQLQACFLSFVVRDAFSYAEVPFHSPTLSSALSNTETIVSTSQETRRKLEEDAAIIQTLTKHGSEWSSTRTVHGKRRA